MRIERTANGSQSGIWALAWNPHPEDGHDLLCVADWAQTISFYSLSGKQVRFFLISCIYLPFFSQSCFVAF
jgi:intraflagellar transport protein 122